MKETYEAGKKKAHVFEVGDKVWLSAKDIRIHQASQKLGPRQLGPYEVIEKVSELDYRLKLPPAMKVHNVFHVNRLSPWKGNDVNGLRPPPPEAVEVEGEEEFEVEQILDSRIYRRGLQYLVRWEGFGEEDDSWEPAANVKNAGEKITEFHQKHPNAPKKIAAAVFSSLPWRKLENLTEGQSTDLEWEEGRIAGSSLSRTIGIRRGVM